MDIHYILATVLYFSVDCLNFSGYDGGFCKDKSTQKYMQGFFINITPWNLVLLIHIGPVQDQFWHIEARPYGHEKSNDDKTTLVAFPASLLLGGGICDSKLTLTDISTWSTSIEGRELPWCHLRRRWWHCRLSTTAVGGGGAAPWWLSVLQCPNLLLRIHCM